MSRWMDGWMMHLNVKRMTSYQLISFYIFAKQTCPDSMQPHCRVLSTQNAHLRFVCMAGSEQ